MEQFVATLALFIVLVIVLGRRNHEQASRYEEGGLWSASSYGVGHRRPARSGFASRKSLRPRYDRSSATVIESIAIEADPTPTGRQGFGRTLAASVSRSSGHNLGSERTYTLYALVHCDGAAGLVRLAGTDPTMSE
jgi:hypothetical protein